MGYGWIQDLERLRRLESFVEDPKFRAHWREIKQENKTDLAGFIHEKLGLSVDPESMFDVLVKRIHEYKRQHLQVLHVITLYHRIKRDPELEVTPRTVIFGGKAAPGYHMAKLISKLIHSVGNVINANEDVRGRLKVVFLPDYNVTLGQKVYPAADLSEQISLAGKEASGTGNMKFAMSGALTIGTLDGANVEMREEVGEENFFLFGLAAHEVQAMKAGGYNPRSFHEADEELQRCVDSLVSGQFSSGDPNLFRPLYDSLMNRDEYMLLADYRSYINCQERVSAAYRDPNCWNRMSILNVARMGKFSSDRAIREYCSEIWRTWPVKVEFNS